MKFTAAVLALAATALAMPQIDNPSVKSSKGPQGDGIGNSNGAATANGAGAGNGVGNQGNSQVRFAVPDNVSVKQASEKCGDNTQLSCCNKATAAGDTTRISEGPLAGLEGLLSAAAPGSAVISLFEQCGKLTVIPIIGDLINQHCKQNVACCQKSGSSSDGSLVGVNLPCIALSSLL